MHGTGSCVGMGSDHGWLSEGTTSRPKYAVHLRAAWEGVDERATQGQRERESEQESCQGTQTRAARKCLHRVDEGREGGEEGEVSIRIPTRRGE